MKMKIHRLANGSEVWNKYGQCKSVEAPYFIIGAADKASAVQEVLSIAEQELNGIPLKEFRVGEFDRDKNLEVTAVYERSTANSQPEETGEPIFSFSAGGTTKHITSAPSVRKIKHPDVSRLLDPGDLVGWNGDKTQQGFQVSGVDVAAVSLRETWEKKMRMGELTTAWRRKIAKAIGTCNAKPFKGWEKGEVLFVDCSLSGTADNSKIVSVRFEFAIRQNEKDATVSDVKIGDVEGWQYVWAITKPIISSAEFQAENFGKPQIQGVYINQVVGYSDFKILGL